MKTSAAAWVMGSENWNLVSTKRAVAVALREPLRSSHVSAETVVASYGKPSEVEELTSRITALRESLGSKCEIAAWRLKDSQPLEAKQSLLEQVWRDVFGGPMIPKS